MLLEICDVCPLLCRLGAPAEPVLLQFALMLQVHINFVLDGVFSTHLKKSSYAFLNIPSLLIYDSDRFSYEYACLFLDDTHFEHV